MVGPMRILKALALTSFIASSVGCVGDLVEQPGKGGTTTTGDMATGMTAGDMAMAAGDGGTTQSVHFDPDIKNDIVSCAAGTSCHSPGGLQPIVTKTDVMADYMGFKMRAMAGENSLVLTKGLAMPSHTGGAYLTSKTDAKYIKWLAWVNAGAPL